jgi:hypothetical protein
MKYRCLVGLICNLLIANQAKDSGLPSRHAVAAEGLVLLTQPSASNASAIAAANFNRDPDRLSMPSARSSLCVHSSFGDGRVAASFPAAVAEEYGRTGKVSPHIWVGM